MWLFAGSCCVPCWKWREIKSCRNELWDTRTTKGCPSKCSDHTIFSKSNCISLYITVEGCKSTQVSENKRYQGCGLVREEIRPCQHELSSIQATKRCPSNGVGCIIFSAKSCVNFYFATRGCRSMQGEVKPCQNKVLDTRTTKHWPSKCSDCTSFLRILCLYLHHQRRV